jgi:GNAT superfamily N-acetyltransferase
LHLVEYREATIADVPAMALCRAMDAVVGPADGRMVAYFEGRHHPQQALAARIGYVAVANKVVIGYIAGHETRRLNCEGEVQYLYVTTECRRQGVGTTLLQRLAQWFHVRGAATVCVNVNVDSPPAAPFYLGCGARPINEHWYAWPDISAVLDR